MDKPGITAIKKFLEENVKNKTYIEYILDSAEDVYYNYEDNEFLKRSSEETYRSDEFLSFIDEYNPDLSRGFTTMGKILRYFVSYSEEPSDEIISELKMLDLKSYSNLRKLPGDYIQTLIYSGYTRDSVNVSGNIKTHSVGSHLFYSVYHALTQTLGIDSSLKFLEEFMRLNIVYDLRKDSRHTLEIFMDAMMYCSDNYEYPIEWNLSQAFLDSKLNRTEKVKNG